MEQSNSNTNPGTVNFIPKHALGANLKDLVALFVDPGILFD